MCCIRVGHRTLCTAAYTLQTLVLLFLCIFATAFLVKVAQRFYNMAEVLKMLEQDEQSAVCVTDSSSDDEDLVFADNNTDSDADYRLPSSESEDSEPGPSRTRQPEGRKRGRKSTAAQCSEAGPAGEEDRWHNREEEDVQPVPYRFIPTRKPGPAFDTTQSWSPLGLFQLFFSAAVVRKIVQNTNANAARRQAAGVVFKWTILTVKDFYTFLAIVIFTGLVTVHHRSDYWRKQWPYNFSFPREKMSRDRFEAILWSLHLSSPAEDEENEKKRNSPAYDRLFKIKPLYTEMVDACKAYFQPYQHVSIDERMVASKACISMKHYIKDKPTKWGYKLYVLADSTTGYTWNFFVDTGKSKSVSGHGLGYSAVMDLLPFSFMGSGYHLYTDNFYTSPALFSDLAKKNIGCCGTIRKYCIGFPKTETNDLPKKAQRGDLRWIRSGDLLFVNWTDTRPVSMCSTIHKAFTGKTVKRKVKEAGVWNNKQVPVPDCIVDYNKYMGGVDLSDQLVGCYSVHHKTTKWYKTFFYHFVDIAVVNSFLLHKELYKYRQDSTQPKPYTQKQFREQLAKEMLMVAGESAATPTPTTCLPAFFEGEGQPRKFCVRCTKAGIRRVKTSLYCTKCGVPLCLTKNKNCFKLWHEGK
uniref:PiggyBac transposable element-derived protein domain-containing protein n=1 Tax=Monopterus albus TaxID=43700 RepID=A0A3Q3KB83_MONAL|nr:piggyBac transposable element-derived protein 4-like [Monopterus albus]